MRGTLVVGGWHYLYCFSFFSFFCLENEGMRNFFFFLSPLVGDSDGISLVGEPWKAKRKDLRSAFHVDEAKI